MCFSNEYTVVLSVKSERDLTRVKIVGHNKDVSLVDSYLRNRIAGLVITRETSIECEYEEPRNFLPDVIKPEPQRN
jgi:hypothetical protein